MTNEPLCTALMDVLDTLEPILGFAWDSAEVRIDRDDDGWRVATVESPGVSAQPRRDLGALGLDPFHWTSATNSALSRLRKMFDELDIAFSEGVLRCHRNELVSAHVSFIHILAGVGERLTLVGVQSRSDCSSAAFATRFAPYFDSPAALEEVYESGLEPPMGCSFGAASSWTREWFLFVLIALFTRRSSSALRASSQTKTASAR